MSLILSGDTGVPVTTVTGTLPVANGGSGVTTSTGSGANVLGTSPTLVTPILGTPTSGNLANCTGVANTAVVWVTFTGSTGTTNGSFNVSSVTRSGTGNYIVNFTNALSSVNFCPTISVSQSTANPSALAFDAGPNLNSGGYTGYASTSSFKFITGNTNTSVPSDPNICSVAIFR